MIPGEKRRRSTPREEGKKRALYFRGWLPLSSCRAASWRKKDAHAHLPRERERRKRASKFERSPIGKKESLSAYRESVALASHR